MNPWVDNKKLHRNFMAKGHFLCYCCTSLVVCQRGRLILLPRGYLFSSDSPLRWPIKRLIVPLIPPPSYLHFRFVQPRTIRGFKGHNFTDNPTSVAITIPSSAKGRAPWKLTSSLSLPSKGTQLFYVRSIGGY